jgi:hypothetical protein
MAFIVKLPYLAPIPVGHAVRILSIHMWTTPVFGGAPHWEPTSDPVVVDVDTGVVYADAPTHKHIVPSPFGFDPQSGLAVAQVVEGRVTACTVGSSGGERASVRTHLVVEPT